MTYASAFVLAPALLASLASCATTSDADARDDGTQQLPEAGAADVLDAGDAAVDGGCDPADPNCVTKPITCEQADWCPVQTGVSNFYALTSVWGSGKNDVWASGSGGSVIHWDGAAWTPTTLPSSSNSPIKNTFRALWGSGPNDVWIASSTDVIFHSGGFVNGSANWERAPDASQFGRVPLFAAWGTNANDVRFGGSYFFADFGVANQVTKKASPTDIEWSFDPGESTIRGFWGSSSDDLWQIGDMRPLGSQVAQTRHGTRQDGAFVWKDVDSRASVILRGIWGSSANDVWTVGDKGTIRHFGPNATEWSVVESSTTRALQSVWGSGPNDVWVVGEAGTILHWDGKEWSPSVAAFTLNRRKPNLYGVWGSGPDDVWIVGDDIVIHHTGGVK